MDLFYAVKIIVDTAINSSNVEIQMNYESAKEFMKKYTLLNDESINAEILQYMASPGHASSCGIGYYVILLLEKNMLQKGYQKIDFYKFMCSFPLPIKILFKCVNEL